MIQLPRSRTSEFTRTIVMESLGVKEATKVQNNLLEVTSLTEREKDLRLSRNPLDSILEFEKQTRRDYATDSTD